MNRINFFATTTIMALAILPVILSPAQAIVRQSWISGLAGPDHRFGDMHGVAADAAGNVYLAGDCQNHSADFIALKYNPEGAVLWTSTFSSQNQVGEYPEAMVADAAGNVYVTGISYRYWESDDVVTIKFDPWGQQLWAAYYNSPNNDDDRPTALVLDEEGNVYVTGYIGFDYTDCFTIKYSADGLQQWAATFAGALYSYDQTQDIAVDEQGNVYVSGFSSNDCVIIKYDSAGVQQWIARHTDPSEDFWYGLLDLDSQGNIYVAGASLYNDRTDYLTIKFNSLGQEVWARRYDGPQHEMDSPCGVKVDAQDNVIVSGTSTTPDNWGNQYVTIKYDANGNQLWLRGYRGDHVESNTSCQRLILDDEGSVYLTGCSAYYSFYPDCGTIKYDAQGNLKWIVVSDYNTTISGGQYLALDGDNNVLVSGWFCYPDQADAGFLTIKLQQIPGDVQTTMTPSVTPVVIPVQGGSFSYELLTVNGVADSLRMDYWWKVIYPTSPTSQPRGESLEAIVPLDSTTIQRHQRVPGNAPAGSYQYIVNAGQYPGIIWATDTLQFTKLSSGNGPLVDGWLNTSEDFDGGTSGNCRMASGDMTKHVPPSISPNPFNPSTAISYELRASSYVSLKVYDTVGRLVTTLVEGWRGAGEHEVRFDGSGLPSGIYIYRLERGAMTETGKMILLK